MRVNPNHNSEMLLALQRVSADENTVLKQISSGKKIQQPSGDPSGMAALVELQATDATTQQFVQNIQAVRGRMQSADSSLSSAVTGLERALTLGVQGANGTLNPTDKEAIGQELNGISAQLLEIANLSSQGTYIFAGTASDKAPFQSVNGDIVYQGNTNVNQVQIGEGFLIRANVPGSTIFGNDTTGTFAAIKQLASAVRTGTTDDVAKAIQAVSAARDQLSAARVAYGNSLNQMDSTELTLNQRHIQLSQQQTTLQGADIAEAATNLATVEQARNALLATMSRSSGSPTLFDYLAGIA